MTIDAARAGLCVREIELPLRHRATGRDLHGFLHRARQLRDTLYACGPLGVNFRGLRLPLVGWKVGLTNGPDVAAIAVPLRCEGRDVLVQRASVFDAQVLQIARTRIARAGEDQGVTTIRRERRDGLLLPRPERMAGRVALRYPGLLARGGFDSPRLAVRRLANPS